MRIYECCFTCHAIEIPREVVVRFATETAREEGFLFDGEEFADWSDWTVSMSPFYQVGGFRLLKVEVIVPEPHDRIDEFMALIDGADLDLDLGYL
jgi:hypothetical protein